MTTPLHAPSDTPSRVREVVAAMLDKKAMDLRVLYLGAISDFTDYFVIASGSSERQVQAIADGAEERLRGLGLRPLSAEGQTRGQWVLLDYGSFLVHVFTEERRAFYGLERLWSDAPDATQELGG
jgi:ribosome-associated protein